MGKYFIIIGFFSAIIGGIGFLPTFLSAYKSLLKTRMSLEMKKLKREAGNDEIPDAKLRSIKTLCTLQVISEMTHSDKPVTTILYTLTGLMLSLGVIAIPIGIIMKLAGI